MRIGSLFSGAGGLDRAVEQVFGGRVVWQSEIDKAASKVLAYRFPSAPNLGDITQIDWATVPPVDVLCGGFPCQDVSAAGKRAGIKDGTRSGLWAVFAEAIDALRPQYVVIENVRGLLNAPANRPLESAEDGVGDGADGPVLRAAGAVLGDIQDIGGYEARWVTVAASSIGAPHRRERVFILANLAVAKGDGWDGGRAESAGTVGGFDAAVSGDEPGRVELLPTPVVTDAMGARNSTAWRSNPDHGISIGDTLTDAMWKLAADRGEMNLPTGPTRGGGDEPGVALLSTPRSSDSFGAGHHGNGGMDLRTTVTLLPTPNAVDGAGGGRYSSAGHQSTLPGEVRLLCTPSASDGSGGKTSRSGGRIDEIGAGSSVSGDEPGVALLELWPTIRNAIGYEYGRQRSNSELGSPMYADDLDLDGLANAATEAVKDLPSPLRAQGKADATGKPPASGLGSLPLLPTPEAKNSHAGPDYARMNREGSGGHDLVTAVAYHNISESQWGKYAPAIARWEALTRPAPAPTEPNKNGNPRLSAAFSEWLMGWPDGWVTDPAIGISRNDQLRIVGNGVCSQQAAAALRYLLAVAA